MNNNTYIKQNSVFKKILEFIEHKYTEDYMVIFRNTIISSSLFVLSNSYYLVNEPGYHK